MGINWNEVATRLAPELPSDFYRANAVELLSRVEHLGPLGSADQELRRVYRFLHYNEFRQVFRVVRTLLERANGRHARLRIVVNAWRYTVAAYDEWICQARIFYLIAGLLEGTLRSRLDERLTSRFGADWPSNDDVVPSFVRDSTLGFAKAECLKKIEKLLAGAPYGPLEGKHAYEVLQQIRALAVPPVFGAPPTGDAFLESLSLSAVQSFFTTKRLFDGKAQLKDLLRHPDTTHPIPLQQVEAMFKRYRDVRNDTAHYRPGEDMTFTQALFTAARVASWLGVDLQHFYSSVDVRHSTELSRLLGPQVGPLAQYMTTRVTTCETEGCAVPPPYDWLLLSRTPWDAEMLAKGVRARRACLFHRVQFRAEHHQHPTP